MQNKNDYITMLGTGNALATRCYNTCFTLHGEKGVLLVDAGGGNGILTILSPCMEPQDDAFKVQVWPTSDSVAPDCPHVSDKQQIGII